MFPDMHNFAVNRNKPVPRSTILKPFRHNLTCHQGDLVPFYNDAVIPGSTFDVTMSFTLKMLRTPFTAVMDDAYIDGYFFFVPCRILYKLWPQVFGVDQPSAWAPSVDVLLPSISVSGNFQGSSTVQANSVLNCLGLPLGYSGTMENPLQFLAYLKIVDAWFRDENIENSDPLIETYYEAASGSSVSIGVTDPSHYYNLDFYRVNKYHDYFTSVLPAPQKNGAPVSLPLGVSAPIDVKASSNDVYGLFANVGTGNITASSNVQVAASTLVPGETFSFYADGQRMRPIFDPTAQGVLAGNLYADLSNATAADVSDLRLAIAMQVYFEALARGGSRYNEYLKSFFGVCPLDATLQRPEFLGGFHRRLNMQQVAQTGGKGTIGVATKDSTGALGAYSNTSGSGNVFVKSFTEYGYVLGVFAIRVKHRYSQGVAKEWRKNSRFDFYNPCFDRLGEVPVAKDEIYAGATGNLGFIPAWSEHRMCVDRISGSITPGVSTDLTAYTYGDNYASAPTLSRSWMAEPYANVEQTLTGATTLPQFVFDCYIENKATQPISIDSVPNSFGF